MAAICLDPCLTKLGANRWSGVSHPITCLNDLGDTLGFIKTLRERQNVRHFKDISNAFS